MAHSSSVCMIHVRLPNYSCVFALAFTWLFLPFYYDDVYNHYQISNDMISEIRKNYAFPADIYFIESSETPLCTSGS
jgi:hypothetical protein